MIPYNWEICERNLSVTRYQSTYSVQSIQAVRTEYREQMRMQNKECGSRSKNSKKHNWIQRAGWRLIYRTIRIVLQERHARCRHWVNTLWTHWVNYDLGLYSVIVYCLSMQTLTVWVKELRLNLILTKFNAVILKAVIKLLKKIF